MFGRRRDKHPWDDEASEPLARFAERRARREQVRLGEEPQDLDWEEADGRLELPVREGHALVIPRRSSWDLYVYWHADYGHAFVLRGSRCEVELAARRIQRNGPSCGPEFSMSAAAWYRFDDDTEHMSIEAGELRLMQPATFDDSVLILAQRGEPDSVAVLGAGEHEALRETAEARGRRGGKPLHVWLGDQPRYLQALGADGLVAYLELGDDLLVLGHLGGGEFLLAWQSGDVQRGLGKYTLAEVMRGDLGHVFDRARSRPGRAALPVRAASPTRPDREKIPPGPTARPWCRRLAGAELKATREHLTPSKEWEGEASTVIPRILGAICGLVHLDLDNLTFWERNFLPFLAKHSGQQIHCCRKILNAALHIIARRTRLLVRCGRRWVLLLGDLRARGSQLLRWITWRGPLDSDLTPRSRAKQGDHAEPAQAPDTGAAPGATEAPDGSPPSTDTTTAAATEPNRAAADSSPADDAAPATTDETHPASPDASTDTATAAATEPNRAAADSSPANDAAPVPETPPASPATTDETSSAGGPRTPSPSVAPPAGRSSSAASSAPGSHAAAASGHSPSPPTGNGISLPPGLSELMRLFAAMSVHDNPGALPPGLPPFLNSFKKFQALLMATMRLGPSRSGRGPGVSYRGQASWTDDDDLDDLYPSGPRAPQSPSGKRRPRPP